MDNGVGCRNVLLVEATQPQSSTARTKSCNKRQMLETLELNTRKMFRAEEPESSADSVKTGEKQIVAFEPFLHYPMAIENGFSVDPEIWAEAFLQPDIGRSASVLSQGLFTQEELEKRRSSGNCVDSLLFVKRLVLMRAAKWMTQKEQDPWSYSPLNHPTEEEEAEVDEAFRTFNRVINRRSYYDDDAVDETLRRLSAEKGPMSSVHGNHIHRFKVHVKLMREISQPISLPRHVQEYTKAVVTQNDDVFVDGVQFSSGRWAKAFKKRSVSEAAVVLFRGFFRSKENVFTKFSDFCPVKRLAIIRAVAWMKIKNRTNFRDFNPAIKGHNLFLSLSEIDQIEVAIDKEIEKENAQRVFDPQVDSQNVETTSGLLLQNENLEKDVEVEMGTLNIGNGFETPIQAQINILFENPERESAKSVAPEVIAISSCPNETTLITPLQDASTEVAHLANYDFEQYCHCQTMMSDCLENGWAGEAEQLPLNIYETEVPVVACHNQLSGNNGHQSHPYQANMPATNMNDLYPVFNEEGDVISPGSREHPIWRDVWSKAYDMTNGEEDLKNKIQVGRFLLGQLFDSQELWDNTIEGKTGNKPHGILNKEKVNTIYVAVSILKAMKMNPTDGGAFQEKSVELIHWPPLNPSHPAYQQFRHDVFIQGRNTLNQIEKNKRKRNSSLSNISSNVSADNTDRCS